MGKYLYCIIKEKRPCKFKQAYTINQGNLAVVVRDLRSKKPCFSREHLIAHQKVIEKVMQQGYDVLPVRFGIVAKSTKDIKEKILKAKRKELLEAFKKTQGKVELGLKALWRDISSIFQEIGENKEIQIAKNQARKNPSQFRVAAVGELVGKALEQKREKEAQKIIQALDKLAVDFKSRACFGDAMIFNSAFLVSKKKEKKFDKRVEEIGKKYDNRIKFIYVGPVPPYNFVNLCF
ncbi:MAG: GvpL/GvpF family gas vesicle protein [bacterium]